MSTYLWFCLQFCRSASLFKDILCLLNGVLNSKQKAYSFFKLVMNMQVLGGCIVLMKQKASFVSASFNESRYEIQGFFAYVISQKRSANQRKKNQNSVYRVKLSPHAKIQLLLNTFKNGRKIKGSFLL